MRSSTGTCSASLWPPVKLYVGKPVHLAAAGGNPGRNSGENSNGAIDVDPSVFMAGLVRPSTPWPQQQDVDARVKPAHDGDYSHRYVAASAGTTFASSFKRAS